jgi:DNA-binding NarL/FixJ family response regulator
VQDAHVIIDVSDDGVGGADVGGGSGLRGLADRVEVLGGRLDIHSPPGDGTVLRARLPLRAPPDPGAARRDSSSQGRSDEIFASVAARVVEPSATIGQPPLRVVVAEDSLLLRAGVIRVLEDAGYDVVGHVGDADGLLREVRLHEPDLAVIDIRMPPTFTDEGLQAARQIRDELPGTGVLLLSQYAEEAYALQLLSESAGGTGYLLKDRVAEPRAFADAVRTVGSGGSVFDPEVIAAMLGGPQADAPLDHLTAHERKVMSAMADGDSYRAIAERLHISEPAVETVVANIFNKLALPPIGDERRRMLAIRLMLHACGTGG